MTDRKRHRGPAGYALIMVIMVLALIALGFGTVLYVVETNLTETRRILGETRCFYALDSASRIATATVQSVAAGLPPTTSPDEASALAVAAVCDIAGGCPGGLPVGIMPAGVQMTKFTADLVTVSGFTVIPSGPFKNIVTRESGMSVFIEGQDRGTGRECHVRDSFSNGTVSPFQFMHFAKGKAKWYGRGNRAGPVPSYASGGFCIGVTGGSTMNLSRVSSGSRMRTSVNGGGRGLACPAPEGGNGTVIVGGVPFLSPDRITSFSRANKLRLPVQTTPPQQFQKDDRNRVDAESVRWILDPVMEALDNEAVKQLRIAELADIRIVDGVWYLKRVGFAWPGVPIYSDHPGANVSPQSDEESELNGGVLVGVDDIKQFLLDNAIVAPGFGATWPPRRYSYYEAGPGGLLDGSSAVPNSDGTGPEDEGILSYGTLIPTGGGNFVPGVWPGFTKNGARLTCSDVAGFQPWTACTNAATPAFKTALLEAARSGFQDFNAEANASGGGEKDKQRKILPLNFDVRAFKNAMLDTATEGELGSYFGGRGRTFNGLVYITQSWKDSLRGVDGAVATRFTDTLNPEQGVKPLVGMAGPQKDKLVNPAEATFFAPAPNPSVAMPADVDAPFSGAGANASWFLPRALCANAEGANGSYSPDFVIPACDGAPADMASGAWGSGGNEGTRPNAVRVFHGADLRPFQPSAGGGGVSTKGLSIATNLPLYVLGDWNSAGVGDFGNFARSMLAGDTITVLSNNWSDGAVPWTFDFAGFTPPAALGHVVPDLDTAGVLTTATVGVMVRAGLFVGRTPPSANPPDNQSSEDLIRNLENMPAGAPLGIRGALMVGFYSVFRNDWQEISGTFPFARTDFKYDTTLAQPALQPPGAPRFILGVAGRWKDTR